MLSTAMAQRCKQLIGEWDQSLAGLPPSLEPTHLIWMCNQIVLHTDDWPATKQHRWLGFVQAAMIANHMLDLASAKKMFDRTVVDEIDGDLVDHLDPSSPFRLEIGGEG
jgi:hypothetical protein